MADSDQSLNNLRYNQVSGSLEGFGGGTPQWTELTLHNVDPTQVPITRLINTTAPLAGGGNLSADRTLSIAKATGSVDGYLSAADWTTFNSKQNALTLGNLTDVGTDGITITNGSSVVVGSGTSISQHVSDSTHNGYLSSTDWSTFNGKLTTTLASTNIFVGNGSNVATAVAMSGDATLSNTGALTIATHAITPAKISNTGTDDFSFPRDTSTARDFILTGGDSKNVKWVGSATATLGLEPGFSALDLGGVDYFWIKRDAGHLSFGTGLDAGFKRLSAGLIGVTTGTDSITGDLQAGHLSLGGTRGASAILDVQSTALGFLKPRMTTTQRDAIASPAEGLQIYNTTTHADNFYNGTSWAAAGGGSPAGMDTQIQYNASGSFGASANLTWNDTTKVLNLANGNSAIYLGGASAGAVPGIDVSTNGVVSTPEIDIWKSGSSNVKVATFFAESTGELEVYPSGGSVDFRIEYPHVIIDQAASFASGDPSSVLELKSTVSGFLPPRMSTSDKTGISSPAEGLVVYDTNLHKLCVFTGTIWETVTSA